METILLDIIAELRAVDSTGGLGAPDAKLLDKIIHKHNRGVQSNRQHFSKKKLMPYYLKVKETDPERWESWGIDAALEKQLLKLLQVKPRRTASGVATITVITKPWQCSSDCLYCPSDLRMPKSYLSDEPACQRAERNFFDPYLQVASRLRALTHMGHVTDKVELIILGGTWSDYPAEYQIWFVTELFRALNDGGLEQEAKTRRKFYKGFGLSNREEDLREFVAEAQQEVSSGVLSFNQGIKRLYYDNSIWQSIATEQIADLECLERQQRINETAKHRVVGLVIETRPDTITAGNLELIRRLGCTKVQIGVQSIRQDILNKNNRNISLAKIEQAFELLRIFGFKIHTHIMLNLLDATPEQDQQEYRRFVSEPAFLPDEIKLYPCALVHGTGLCRHYDDKSWRPYTEAELLEVLVADTLATPAFTRISRMIRDISASDIVVGNKKANLRQMVERRIEESGERIGEIRHREVSTSELELESLSLETVAYKTTVSEELFLQWVTPENRIAGFLRLSLPEGDYVAQNLPRLPIGLQEAMIREVHVYGKVAGVHKTSDGAQHLGLGKQLIQTACEIAKAQGYTKINVISSVGTREYYRGLGFKDNGLYQQLLL